MMLRIDELEGDDATARLAVEGRITAHTLESLRQACDAALARRRQLGLDVSQVQFVDPAGLDFLRELQARGATLEGCSGFLFELFKTRSMR